MEEKLVAFHANKTWSLVAPPIGANIVTCKWIFKVKKNANESFSRRKARLVVRGLTKLRVSIFKKPLVW